MTGRTKTAKITQPTRKPNKAKVTDTRRDWSMYLWYCLAAAWAVVAIKLYVASGITPDQLGANEPHPVIEGVYAVDTWSVAVASLAPLLPLALLVASLVAARHVRWRKVVLYVQSIAVIGLLIAVQVTTARAAALQAATPQIETLQQVIVKRAQCGDAVRGVDNYNFGAKTFYELKDQGYRLKATYQSATGMLDSDSACATYYSVRNNYPSDRIVLQLFTYDDHNTPAPYLYKYAEQRNVVYGIFVKE